MRLALSPNGSSFLGNQASRIVPAPPPTRRSTLYTTEVAPWRFAVYPDARVEIVRGGLRLLSSPPPVRWRSVVVALPVSKNVAVPQPKPAPEPVRYITEDALDRVRAVAPGWDRQWLLAKYKAWSAGKPAPDNPDASFVAWARKFTKGKAP